MSLPVVCLFCNETIYDYTGPTPHVELKAEHFEPRSGFPAPDATSRLACPNCGERWVAVSVQIEGLRMAVDPSTRGTGTVRYEMNR
jgi:hypothetical protein